MYVSKGLQVDILRNEGHDLHKEAVWAWVLRQLEAGMVDLFLVAPPCNTHSRARCQYRKHGGPRPLRDYNFPHGFPWLSQDNKDKVRLADELVQKAFTGCLLTCERGGFFFLEHPEQLGLTAGQIPASIWDLPEVAELLCKSGVHTFAVFQCAFHARSSKPTRFLTSLDFPDVQFPGLQHCLDSDGKYKGPLPPHCPHGPHAHAALVGKDSDGRWKTEPSATYPPELCRWIAYSAWPNLLRLREGEGKSMQEQKESESTSAKGTSASSNQAPKATERTADDEEDSFHGCLVGALEEHQGMPMVCNWHARKPSSFNDGCGLCSPGRWAPSRRNFQKGNAASFINKLSDLIKDFTHRVIPDTQRAFFALALGKLQVAPFSEDQMSELRKRWFQLLPYPAEAAVAPEGQPFFLHAVAQTARLMGEEDADVLDTGDDNYCDGRMVGFNHTFPRVPLVFRPKVKERKYDETEFRADNSNYESAKEHSQQIEVQFQEEERMGFMFPLSEGEARRRYGDRMRVASLGAIPKDDERVRVIFDATHFVQINNGIRIQDRLEFPGPEASATVMEETLECGHRLMIAVAADIALAHRRFKHRESDVGLLGCRVEEQGPIWFNRVGTFGVACAAYHFARLASLLGRLVMRLGGQSHTFQLLFADDLKLAAAGEDKYDQIWYKLVA